MATTSPVAVATQPVPARVTKPPRISSVDLLRGLIMIVMALDHTRDFFTNVPFPPEDVIRTSGALFFTRFITHYCAPVFFLLAGTGASLAISQGKTLSQVSGFLWTRGLWLVFLEFTFVGFAWTFVFPFGTALVLWALGWSMVALAAALIFHQPDSWLWHGAFFLQRTPSGYGHGLAFVYAMWLLAVALLYFPCLRYMEFKQRHRDWNWLSYL